MLKSLAKQQTRTAGSLSGGDANRAICLRLAEREEARSEKGCGMDFFSNYTMTINGEGVRGEGTFDVVNPATEKKIAEAPDATCGQLDSAVTAARQAFDSWRRTPISTRQEIVKNIGEAVAAHCDELAQLLTMEQGRPQAQAVGEVMSVPYWCSAYATMDIPATVNEDSDARYSETRRVPLGVVCGISPWNFPIGLSLWKIAPALLAGNTIVLKPSPFTPLCVLKIGELLRELVPPGVVNVISGGDQLGPWMTAHPDIDKISFTGSSATGSKVLESASSGIKRVTLELGGNDAAIILPDADVAAIAEKIFWAAFSNSGQLCIASKRIYIHESIYEPMKAALIAVGKSMKIGDGSDPSVTLGPLQNKLQYARVKALIEETKDAGYKVIEIASAPDGKGYFLPAMIVDNPPLSARVVREEQFGPIVPLLKFSNIDEVIRDVNNSDYGLAGSVWTAYLSRGVEIAQQIQSGTVWVNTVHGLSPFVPFAGHKRSGLGVENGIEGLLEFTLPKSIIVEKSAL